MTQLVLTRMLKHRAGHLPDIWQSMTVVVERQTSRDTLVWVEPPYPADYMLSNWTVAKVVPDAMQPHCSGCQCKDRPSLEPNWTLGYDEPESDQP
jgi:hypothetical protein